MAMRTVNEVSRLAGVSVRTLHHYDAIGLLKPAEVTEAGYRLYDEAALSRLQSILMFRELQFPLKEIKAILDNPDFDPGEALRQQIRLLELQLDHIKKLIALAVELEKGGKDMAFDAFDKSEMTQYAKEVKERWGSTDAYKEYEQRAKGKTEEEMKAGGKQLMEVFAGIGALRDLSPEDNAVQEKIRQLQGLITEHYYTCTDEILDGLSQMYVCDDRMKRNIDKAGGEGTAEFVREAVARYVRR